MEDRTKFDATAAARRLDHLLDAFDARPNRPYSNGEFAAELAAHGETLSVGDVERMRVTGYRLDDPVMLAVIEAATGIRPNYFSDEQTAESVEKDLELLLAVAKYKDAYRRSGVVSVSMCGALPSPEDREATLEWYRIMTGIFESLADRSARGSAGELSEPVPPVAAVTTPLERPRRRRWLGR